MKYPQVNPDKSLASYIDAENEFIADEVFTGSPKNHHNIWVLDREIPK